MVVRPEAEHVRRLEMLISMQRENPDVPFARVAEALGMTPSSFVKWRIDKVGCDDPMAVLARMRSGSETSRLLSVGYTLDGGEMTPEQAWAAGHAEFERTVAKSLASRWRVIERPRGPFCIFHQTDVHVDDPGAALRLIEADIASARGMGAVMAHGGDASNNWPMIGKLAKQWAEQECSKPMALLRLEHYIHLFDPDAWATGNHEEFNPYFVDLIKRLLPEKTLFGDWMVNFVVATPDGRPVRVVLAHKFLKGSSWFHSAHGHLREMLEGQQADLLLDGHRHVDGVMDHTLPERGHSSLCVASGGYKFADKYARRISRASGEIRVRGRAHWVICDPFAEYDESLCVAFKSAEQAEAYLGGIQNLRAI